MIRLQLFSEPFHASGGIDARAAKRAIGRPNMDPWAVFLREALQNSWDARLHPNGSIRFSVDAYWMDSKQVSTLRDRVFRDTPPKGLNLRGELGNQDIALMVLTDQDTHGLGGPTRADVKRSGQGRTDFIDFVRNIGRSESKGFGGGTYGFGKGVLYEASTVNTLVVYSRTSHLGKRVNRLIGTGLGSDYDDDGKHYTGRHWWGVPDPATGSEPLTGPDADKLAESLGMTRLRDGTGTSIAVVAPVAHAQESVPEIVRRIADGALWWAWPHMLDTGSGPSIHFHFTCDGEVVAAPDPLRHPHLKFFAQAYVRAFRNLDGATPDTEWPWKDSLLRSARPDRQLGSLSYRTYPRPTVSSEDDHDHVGHHIALMRSPRFVVKYMGVPEDPSGIATAGVFIAHPRADEDFAKAEPVAHDNWMPENLQLERYARNPVKQALDKLSNEFKRRPVSDIQTQTEESFSAVARLANDMGALIDGVDGTGAHRLGDSLSGEELQNGRRGGTRGRAGGRSASGRVRDRATVEGTPALRLEDRRVIARFTVRVSAVSSEVLVSAASRVVLDGGATEGAADPPLGGGVPTVLAIGGEAIERNRNAVVLTGPREYDLWVDVVQPTDTVITLEVACEVAG